MNGLHQLAFQLRLWRLEALEILDDARHVFFVNEIRHVVADVRAVDIEREANLVLQIADHATLLRIHQEESPIPFADAVKLAPESIDFFVSVFVSKSHVVIITLSLADRRQ